MKRLHVSLALLLVILAAACNNEGKYVDLNTGKTIEVEKDSKTGYIVNVETKKPVYLYVNTATRDTIYGRTGNVVNGNIVTDNGSFKYVADVDYDYEGGDYKMKMNADGSYKIKEGDYKKKVDADGSIKIKDGDTKIKIDEHGNKEVIRH